MAVSREQAAKILCTLLDFMKIPFETDTLKTFTDADAISPWAAKHVARAASAGLLIGDGDTFRPQDSITREEAAVMLERIFVNLIEPNLPQNQAPAA